MAKRTCDKGKKYVPLGEYYNIVIREGNKNTIFLISNVESQADRHSFDVVDQGSYKRPKEYSN